ncbi:MAG: dethiobiotin synthase [Gemmataceae bacterium]
MKGLLVTGTDTGVGKTEITAAIARLWRREGRRFAVCKPVATGAVVLPDGSRLADDARLLAAAAGETDLRAVTPHVLLEPAAPPVAARLEGVRLEFADLIRAIERRSAGECRVLAEGVGGLLCPLTERETVADLAAAVQLPLLVVARRSLGTLNHTLLTVEVARQRGLRVVGVVVTETTPVATVAERENAQELRLRLQVPLLAVVPHRPGGYDGEIPALSAIDWWSLSD